MITINIQIAIVATIKIVMRVIPGSVFPHRAADS
jgi:hypothetical protein